ncbi:type VI secretion system lipoprotein TssJ [Pseudomonas sp.]|uniref:type VI secretion system lipoprotein TssJ n=1 Tax=Pseudomonas sp. TaxID=306 RepID=UPI00260ED90B|nr:type VI secretion system lipoprotein TssJ [Pseudomonas sp.]
MQRHTRSISPLCIILGRYIENAKLVLLLLTLALAGCSSNDPQEDKSTLILLRIHAAANLNQGTHKKPLAQVIKIYHLRATERFEQTPFDSFLDDTQEQRALGSDLVNSREMLLMPEQHYELNEKLENGAAYIGIVAFFRQPAERRWRFAYDANASATTGITLGVHACALTSTQGALINATAGTTDTLATVKCPSSR